ncbi:FKBP-type peptidyl-prolyl cis-trans isomerase [Psychromonas sp.]|uniref:FKBP-type peptidyl-prolyl cis-trans isomerase n=1 Tax=Psychromonas sp. TaxID=1884585 RepID=UPI00356A4453
MKTIFKVSFLAAAVALTFGCDEKQESAAQEEVAAVQESVTTEATFESEEYKAAYAIGASFATQIKAGISKQAEFGLATLDEEAIIAGVSDTLRGSAKLTEQEMMETVNAYGQEVQAAAEKKMQEQAAKAAEEAELFLAENAKAEGVTVTESGLQYSVITAAEGAKPNAEDTVTVHYVGTLVDGTEFDSSVSRGEPAKFPLNRVIPGWTEGVQLMSIGEKYKFVIPAELAYGAQGAGSIPPGATLIFEVELLDIEAAASAEEAAPAQ